MPYVYAPGCALTDYKPELAEKILRYLQKTFGDVPLYDTCCRVDCTLPNGTTVINTCPGCNRRFQAKREGISTVSLWEVLAERDDFPFPDYGGLTLAIHDACPTRGEPKVHEAVRTLLARMNIRVAEPEFTKDRQNCCGDSAYPEKPLPEIYAQMKAPRRRNARAGRLRVLRFLRQGHAHRRQNPALPARSPVFASHRSQRERRRQLLSAAGSDAKTVINTSRKLKAARCAAFGFLSYSVPVPRYASRIPCSACSAR